MQREIRGNMGANHLVRGGDMHEQSRIPARAARQPDQQCYDSRVGRGGTRCLVEKLLEHPQARSARERNGSTVKQDLIESLS